MRGSHIEGACMRGDDCQQAGTWGYLSREQRVPSEEPPLQIQAMLHAILAAEPDRGKRLTRELQAAGPG